MSFFKNRKLHPRAIYWLITNQKTKLTQKVLCLSHWLQDMGYIQGPTPNPFYKQLIFTLRPKKGGRALLDHFTIERVTADPQYDATFTAVTGGTIKRNPAGWKTREHVKFRDGVIR